MTPTSTYRLQLTPAFTLLDAAGVVPYLAELGVSHVYCSPWLTSAPGSQHGYDVVDHSAVDPELGGDDGVAALHSACAAAGIGIVLDIVPNHMHVGAPQSANAAWWDVLTHGEDSPFARWFDIDWSQGPVRLPVLGDGDSGPDGGSDDDGGLLTYGDNAYPRSAAFQLAPWREGPTYRRFFDVDTLAGLRVEDPEVFAATHRVVLGQVAAGIVSGLRVDHPDGLAEPEDYLADLTTGAPGAWVVVEKILSTGEELPTEWACAGTTGYDAMTLLTQLFCDPDGETPLTELAADLGDDTAGWPAHVDAGKRYVLEHLLSPEVTRVSALASAALPDLAPEVVRDGLVELLVHLPVYRAYVRPGHPPSGSATRWLDEAATQARLAAPALEDVIDALVPLLLGAGDAELIVRFQQASGPVMAKGVEDTACYRALRLVALNEVGGEPGMFGLSVDAWHRACARTQETWPTTMTTLSTHDTKRSEDVRARLLMLSEDPASWRPLAVTLTDRGRALGLDPHAAYLAAQTLLGTWPIEGDRLAAYLTKATKEAKLATSWTDADRDYDQRVVDAGRALPDDAAVRTALDAWCGDPVRQRADSAASAAMKLLQLTMPGVPDCYQGCERTDRSLADPDNRRPVDWAALATSLSADADPKHRVTSTVLRLRRAAPDWFGIAAEYAPLALDDDRFVGFTRADRVAVIATRRPWLTTRDDVPVPSPGPGWKSLLDGVPGVGLHVRADHRR